MEANCVTEFQDDLDQGYPQFPDDADLDSAIGEIQNIQREMETYFDPKNGIILQRLEGVEARLKELTDTLLVFFDDAGSNPHAAAAAAWGRTFELARAQD